MHRNPKVCVFEREGRWAFAGDAGSQDGFSTRNDALEAAMQVYGNPLQWMLRNEPPTEAQSPHETMYGSDGR